MEEFANLVDRYCQALYRSGFSLAKDPERASDLVQQTFVTWAQKGHQASPGALRIEHSRDSLPLLRIGGDEDPPEHIASGDEIALRIVGGFSGAPPPDPQPNKEGGDNDPV